MDPNSSNKIQKNYEGDVKNEGTRTFLCDLPDDLLQKIITYISIKEAVATSTLSKRWENQWIGNYKSNMELIQGLFLNRQHFIDFVEKLYKHCKDDNPRIVSLSFEVGNDFRRVNKWLSAFINPMIEELNLELDRIKKPLVLPNHFFTSRKLTKFRLSMKQVIKIPSTINFQNLVILTLKNVTLFPNNQFTQKFFICFPSLKELTFIECDWKKVGSLTIICEELQKLYIREWEFEAEEEEEEDDDEEEEDEEEDVEEQNEEINFEHGEIGFHAPKLLTFAYIGDLINDYFLFSTTSITDASIEVHENNNSTLHADNFVSKIFNTLIRVEKLSITDFVLEQMTYGILLDKNDENEIYPIPACFETHLKIIKIHGFIGAEDQLNAIKFLLKTTQVLETLYIHTSDYYFESHEGKRELEKMYLKILRFPKASMDCIINLE
ncbi:FBD, F-box and Leucine Rich Repeat domains containing protein [Trifolium repens]|nr:FBD, F-box and Leucine Rich Repeat domains containing protein [Trifolium repens]